MTYPNIDESAVENQNAQIHPVDVRVIAMPEGMDKPKTKTICRQTFRTIVVAANSFSPLLDGPDPSRYEYFLIALDAPIVLTQDQGSAQSPNNTVTNFPNPQAGAVIPNGLLIGPLSGQTQVFASAATGTRVSIISAHKVPYA